MRIKATIIFILGFSSLGAVAQTTQFSLATDVDVIYSFRKQQKFWTIGQTIAGHLHFTPKDGAYAMFSYSGNGKFRNQLEATANDVSTVPQQFDFVNKATMSFYHVSLGWKRYFVGTYNNENGWNLYGYAGFGLVLGKIFNAQSPPVDTFTYHSPVMAGRSSFRRLTIDFAGGFEVPAGGGVYFYTEGRMLVPATDYPNKYLLIYNDAPLIGSVNLGVRILFD